MNWQYRIQKLNSPVRISIPILFTILFILFQANLFADSFESKANAVWNSVNTWTNNSSPVTDVDGMPDSDDSVTLKNSVFIDVGRSEACSSISISDTGAGLLLNAGSSLSSAGSFTIGSQRNVTLSSGTTLSVEGSFDISSLGSLTVSPSAGPSKIEIKFLGGGTNSGTINLRETSPGTTTYLEVQSFINNGLIYITPSAGSVAFIESDDYTPETNLPADIITNLGYFFINYMGASSNSKVTIKPTINNSGYLYSLGRDPNPANQIKPDESTFSRSVKLYNTFSTGRIFLYNSEVDGRIKLTGINGSSYVGASTIISNCHIHPYGFSISTQTYLISRTVDTITEGGLVLSGCSRLNRDWYENSISSNIVEGFPYAGVNLTNTTKWCEIRNNTIRYNKGGNIGFGLRLDGSSEYNIIQDNRMHDNKFGNLYMYQTHKNLIDSNFIYNIAPGPATENNLDNGIYIKESNYNHFLKNISSNNWVHGITLDAASYNYFGSNVSCNNRVGGIRFRYSSNDNLCVGNQNYGNNQTGLTSYDSVRNIFADDLYGITEYGQWRNNQIGDIYIEGEQNTGKISQLWLLNCLSSSTVEFTDVDVKQEFTKEGSWVIAQKYRQIPGLTKIWGHFSLPQSWFQSSLKFNFADQSYSGWSTTPRLSYLDATAPPVDFDITSITVSSTTKSELWILTYQSTKNRWEVRGSSSGVQKTGGSIRDGFAYNDDDYKSDNAEIGFKVTARETTAPGQRYVFATIAPSGDSSTQKTVKLCDFKQPEYIGAKFTNDTGGTVEIEGTAANPTIISRDLPIRTTDFSYSFILGGTVNKINYADFSYLNANGLNLKTAVKENPSYLSIRNTVPGKTYTNYNDLISGATFARHIYANAIAQTFDNIYLDSSPVFNICAVAGADLVFRDYYRWDKTDALASSSLVWDPTLDWSGISGYTSDGIEPNHGESNDKRIFEVKYTDRGSQSTGDAPGAIQVWIDLDDDLSYSATEKYVMSREDIGFGRNDNDYTNGEYYITVSTPVFFANDGILKYRFYAGNSKSTTVVNGIEENLTTGAPVSGSSLTVQGALPVLEFSTFSFVGLQSGSEVQFSFTLTDQENRICSVKSYVSSNDGVAWSTPTLNTGNILGVVPNLVSWSTGTRHTFSWNSEKDVPNSSDYVKFKLIPVDMDGTGAEVISNPFSANNVRTEKIKFTSTPVNTAAGVKSSVVRVEAQNNNSYVNTRDTSTLILSISVGTATFFDSGGQSILYGSTIAFSLGIASFTVYAEAPGNKTLYAKVVGQESMQGTQAITINTGGPDPGFSLVSVNQYYIPVGTTPVLAVTVNVRDRFNNPIFGSTVTISVSGTGHTIVPPGTVLSTKAEKKTITVTADGVELTQKPEVEFYAWKPDLTYITWSLSPSATGYADGISTVTVSATVKDAYQNLVSTKAVTISLEHSIYGNYGFIYGVRTADTNSLGSASCTFFATKTGTYNIGLAVEGLFVSSNTLSFIPGSVSSSSSTISVTSTGSKTANGTDQHTFKITLIDSQLNPVANKTVTISVSGSSNTITQPAAVTNSNGECTAALSSSRAETKTVTAYVDGVQLAGFATVAFVSGPADSSVSVVEKSSTQEIKGDNTSRMEVSVRVKDANQNPVAGKKVTFETDEADVKLYNSASGAPAFSADSSNPRYAPVEVFSDSSGTAKCYLTSSKPGEKTLRAVIEGQATPLVLSVIFAPAGAAPEISNRTVIAGNATSLGKMMIMFQNPSAGPVVLKIYNLSGAEIINKDITTANNAVWDLKNESGEFVEAGIYIYKLEIAGAVKTGSFAVLK